MNFFEAQRKAKHSTFTLLVLFGAGVLALIVLSNLIIVSALTLVAQDTSDLGLLYAPQTFIGITTAVLLLVGAGSLYKVAQLSKGGKVVATALGGRLLLPDTTALRYQKVLNVVEEMAIASGIPVPPVYILDEEGINAFAAGKSYEDAVIGITEGAAESLTRDELQGVIAHEFSHIFNGDMRLNLRIMGTLHGILLIGLLGKGILRTLGHSSGVQISRSNKKSNSSGAFFIIGAGLTALGYIGFFVGEWIKALISRQREYLADASAVQYTRYPDGIAGALKKIGAAQMGSQLQTPYAQTFSHAYFADGVQNFWDKLFATHPPLSERIKRIDPSWNGVFEVEKTVRIPKEPLPEKESFFKKAPRFSVGTAFSALESMGRPVQQHIIYARNLISALPAELLERLHTCLGAQALILALLENKEPSFQRQQHALLQADQPQLLDAFEEIKPLVAPLQRAYQLPLIQLSMPALKALSKGEYQEFKSFITHFFEIDRKISLFEWSLEKLVIYPLDIHFEIKHYPKERHRTFRSVKKESEILFSVLSQCETQDEKLSRSAFFEANNAFTPLQLSYRPRGEISILDLNSAVETLQKGSLEIRAGILKAVIASVQHDEMITPLELELVHVIVSLLRLPLPSLMVTLKPL